MVAIKYDVSDVEAGGGGEQPDPKMYPGKIVSLLNRKKRSDGAAISDFEVVVDIGSKYVRLWTYVKLPDDPNWAKDSHGWKLRELTDALGLPPKGSIDPKKVAGTPVLVKVVADSDLEGNYRGKIKNLFPLTDEAKAQYGEEPEDAEPAEAGSDEGPYERSEIESWDDSDIKSYADEIGAEGPQSGRAWKTKLIDSIIEAQDASTEGDGDENQDAVEAGPGLEGVEQEVLDELKDDPEHYSEWSDDDVKWMVEGLGIDGNVPTKGRGWRAKAVAAIVELAAGGGESGGEAAAEGDAEVPDDYDDEQEDGSPLWSDSDLKDEIAERNEQGAEIKVAGRATRQKMIDALREDNKNAEPF